MKIVVTGASGNVGTALLRALAADDGGHEITGVERRRPELELPGVAWREADIARDELEPLLRGADAVVHLAWLIQPSRDERTTHRVNVEGSARVFAAAARAGVGTLVHASSVGAYSPGPKDRAVDESWPTDGIATSFYSRHKAAVERILDSFEAAHPDVRVVRLRPGLIFQREAASEIRRYFLGPLLPRTLFRRGLIPFVPRIPGLRFQAVHSADVARAYRLALHRAEARGAYNIAADPVLDPGELARLLDATCVPVPAALVRAAAALTWRARLQPAPEGWVDLALRAPIMDSGRARRELGWEPRRSAGDALLELLDGLRAGAGYPTPPLDPTAGGPLRAGEALTGVGARSH